MAGGGPSRVASRDEIERLPRVPSHVVFGWDAVPRADS
jgi:hypothetical protein